MIDNEEMIMKENENNETWNNEENVKVMKMKRNENTKK